MGRAGDRWISEFRWAARNVRARRWRAALVVALLAVAMAANALVFATADSLVFKRVPYPDAERLIAFEARDPQTGRPTGYSDGPAALDEWRRQTDIFDGVHAYLHKVIFLAGNGEPELVNAADVTVGLIETLGMRPRWGRGFIDGDDRQATPQAVVIAESLARERFGEPSRAVGQRLDTTADPLVVVGVMPANFRFPSDTQRIWRALDPRGPLARGYGLTVIARLSARLPLESAANAMAQRSPAVAAAAGAHAERIVYPAPLGAARSSDERRRMLVVLVGAALCLLLIACANVASLELASAVGRARTYAIQLAVGASRASLARTALLEGAAIVGSATAAAFAIAWQGAAAVTAYLPRTLVAGSTNPIDVDARVLSFMVGIAAITWLLATLPAVVVAWRAPIVETLKTEGPASTASTGSTRFRRGLTVAQIAVAVLLLVGSVLYVRSYLALLALDKGFDSSGVVAISLTIPPQLLGTAYDRHLLAERILERVREVPGVLAAFEGSPPPSTGDSPTAIDQIEVDDRPPFDTDIRLSRLWVTPDYFKALGIPLRAGRMLEPADPPTNVLITEALARRLWPDGHAVGGRFREDPTRPWHHVVGVVGHVRTLQDRMAGREHFQLYSWRPTPKPATAAPASTGAYAGPAFGMLTITARIDSPARARHLYDAARSVDARNILKVEFVDDRYAAQHADRLLATRLVSGFGVLAFVIAMAGIYGLMTFLVADRAREIGVRVALGAEASDVRRLVIGSSLKLVAGGAVAGIFATLAVGRWVQSELHDVAAADPLTLAGVSLFVAAVAVLATLPPASLATRVDPTILLR